jgi:hypothetical protein
MRQIRASRPSPTIVVAVLALVAALAGTAVAGPDASTSAISKKKVKRIAKKQATKQINKLARGLSVAHATTATSALNADQLDGLDSSAFQRVRDRVFQVGHAEVLNFPAGSTLAELTVPDGTYFALAKLSIIHPDAGNDATTTCNLSVPGPLDDSQQSRMGGGGTVADQLGFPLATTFTGAGQLSLSCSNFSGNNDAFNIKLIALRLD